MRICCDILKICYYQPKSLFRGLKPSVDRKKFKMSLLTKGFNPLLILSQIIFFTLFLVDSNKNFIKIKILFISSFSIKGS